MKRVLVVEDEASIREMVALNLKMAGWEVIEAPSAERALELMHGGEPCDAALLDIMLPGMDGLSLCETIRRDDSDIGIIIVSAKGQESDKIRGLSIGADDYITKPFSVSELIARLADGAMRDALSILDQCAALAEGTITAERVRQILGLVGHDWIYKMTKALAARNVQEALQILAELLRDGKDLKQVLSELSLHLRSLMIFQAAGTVEAMDLYAEPQDVLQDQAKLFAPEVLPRMIARLHEAMTEMKWSPQPRITVEVALMELCRPELTASREAAEKTAGSVPQAALRSPADEARIAKLEAALAQVTSLLKQATAGGRRQTRCSWITRRLWLRPSCS